ncbi:hypothetical protein EF903_15465, partial [Streptomyces sp. WAC05292]|uniref:hypothetical protein n=1 Tax=Streptomyces sp. WAC05292 TaxID=2487418 RepID=UPI000F93B870
MPTAEQPLPAPPALRDLARLLRAAGLDPSAEELSADARWAAGGIGAQERGQVPEGGGRRERLLGGGHG